MITRCVDHAYLHGMTQALIVCIGTLAVSALLILALLPRHAPTPAEHTADATTAEPPPA
ncbi:MAG: hypothetical protein JWN52_6343 [Actinomycetia bacterium]|nr:hypothetical protein [Actinomycetes bacterium]